MGYVQKDRPILGRDIPWNDAREKICRVVNFSPLAKVENGKVTAWNSTTPYALLMVECEGLSGEAMIWVTHRLDFLHLWQAFKQRNEANGEEILVIPRPRKWSILRNVLPIMRVWLCPEGAFNKILHPELRKPGEAGFLEVAPIAEWKEDSK